MKTRKILSLMLALVMVLSFVPTLTLMAFADETITIPLGTDGKPASESGTGWTYDDANNELILQQGYKFTVDGECEANIYNLGTIVGGTYNGTVNNKSNDKNARNITSTIENGTFNGDVNTYHSWCECVINNGTFNGKVTSGNHGVVNGGVFNGTFDNGFGGKITAGLFKGDYVSSSNYSVSGGTFLISFVTNGGSWTNGYTAPSQYTYSTSAGIALPSADEISMKNCIFNGWYTTEDFSGNPVTKIPAKSAGKLTYYARFTDASATWKLVGEQATETTDYKVDENGNYTVYTAKGLAKIANIVNGGNDLSRKTVTLANDIDLLDGGVTGYAAETVSNLNSWIPIDGFCGNFDGNGKKIKNLYISYTDKSVGLFRNNFGTIKNLEVASGEVKVTASSSGIYAGGICATTSGNVENCINRANVSAVVNYAGVDSSRYLAYAGGISGLLTTSPNSDAVTKITDCTNYGNIKMSGSSIDDVAAGGIVGVHSSGLVEERKTAVNSCVNNGDISLGVGGSGGRWAGGIAGKVESVGSITATITNCSNKGGIGGNFAGGVVGLNQKSHVYNSYNGGVVTGGSYAGGVVGYNDQTGTVANCYNYGNVTGAEKKGGVVGKVYSGSISNSYYLNTACESVAAEGETTNCTSFTASDSGYNFGDNVSGTMDLLSALNMWVNENENDDYYGWISDTQNSNYPNFGKKITIEKTDKSHTYDGNAYDVSQMFVVDSNAGEITYSIATGGTGEGVLDGKMLTITKVGTFNIKITTAANGNYCSGEKTATLTVLPEKINTAITFVAPVKNATPQTSIETDEYTATVEWTPEIAEGGTFAKSTEYTAKITITPKANYTVSGIAENGYTLDGATSVTNAVDSNVVTAVFPKTASGSSSNTGSITGGSGSYVRYTVKFDTNLGSVVSNQYVSSNGKVTRPQDPTKGGYIFGGWYTDEEFTTEYDFDTKVTKNITLYAKWIEGEVQNPDNNENLFDDVNNDDWFFDYVKYVSEKGLMNGITSNTFAPNENLTRAMLVTVLYRLEGEPAVNKSIPFVDVNASQYYANAVIWAEQNGIVLGISETEFAPDEYITREQIATIIYRYAKYKGYDVSVGENTNILSYTDFEEISEYAIKAMQYAVGSGLMKGKTESTLNPKDNATRSEIAAILNRFIEGNK